MAKAAVPTFAIQGQIDQTPLGTSLRYLIDDAGKQGLEDVLALPDTAWTMSNEAVPSFGFILKPMWFNGRIHNTTEQAQSYLLDMGYNTLDDVRIYIVRNGVVTESYHTGDLQPFNNRPVFNRNFLVPLQIAAGEQVDFV